jgi:hypothetical protein
MQVFDDLHVIGRDDQANVAQGPHFPALEAGDANGRRSRLSGHLQRPQNVPRISAAADGKRNVLRLDEIPQLL